ncbi:MAG: hypothetical protein JWN00_3658 [Actinomycetia bacterium]|jgi:DNA-binding transcriptional regulator PaaX|nr:hypothetical protein [Actinomycetes bacterium]
MIALVASPMSSVLVETLRSPALPARLFPPDWALLALRSAMGEVSRLYGPPSHAHIQQVLNS